MDLILQKICPTFMNSKCFTSCTLWVCRNLWVLQRFHFCANPMSGNTLAFFGLFSEIALQFIINLFLFVLHPFLLVLSLFRSLPLLLPAVEDGIFNDSWRIRQSSVELLGDLLFKVNTFLPCPFFFLGVLSHLQSLIAKSHFIQVAGTSGKALLEGGSDDEGASTEAQGRAIIEVLGKEKRDEVLAALYMVRTDISLSVRQVGRTSHLASYFHV